MKSPEAKSQVNNLLELPTESKAQTVNKEIPISSNSAFNYIYSTSEGAANKYISPFEKLYNPFENENDEEDNKASIDPKAKKRNYLLPIFYNPYSTLNSSTNASNTTNIANQLDFNVSNINNYIFNFEKSKDIYQVWSGFLQNSKLDFPVKFLTTYPEEIFRKIADLPQTFTLMSKTVTKEVVNYLEKNITKDEKIFMFLWVEIDDEQYIVSYFINIKLI